MWKIDKLDEKPEYIFEEALLLYVRSAEGLKDTDTKKRHAKYWREKFQGRALSSLTTQEILNHIPMRSVKTNKPLTNSTKNKYIQSILRILNLAHQAGLVDKVPHLPKNKEPPIRGRWITKDQANRLLNAFSQDWMRAICSFALMTGVRRTEILTMTWDKIDFARRIAIVSNDVAKSGKANNDEAASLFVADIRNMFLLGEIEIPLTTSTESHLPLRLKNAFCLISIFTLSATLGRAGTSKQERHSLHSKNWVDGKR